MAQTWVKVMQAYGDEAESVAASVGDFAEGEYGLLEFRLPFEPPAPLAGLAKTVAEAAGVHLWDDPYIEGDTLIVPFQKRSPALLVLLPRLLVALATVTVLAAIWVTVYKAAETVGEAAGSLVVLGAIAAAAVVLVLVVKR